MIYIARANTTFMGIDYTFRRKFEKLNIDEKKGEINHLKQRKNELQMRQHISDLEKTILLNQECISKIIPTMDLKENEKKKLISTIEKINKFFNNKKEYRQKIKDLNGKILMNKQIVEEIKRRRDEISFFHKDQIKNVEASVTKKGGAVKQFQKKFNEVEIFIQRESVTPNNMEKYGKWKTFTLIPFMKKNEDLLKKKCFYEKEINKIKEKINVVEIEKENLKDFKNVNNKIDNQKMISVDKYFNNYIKLYENVKEFCSLKMNNK